MSSGTTLSTIAYTSSGDLLVLGSTSGMIAPMRVSDAMIPTALKTFTVTWSSFPNTNVQLQAIYVDEFSGAANNGLVLPNGAAPNSTLLIVSNGQVLKVITYSSSNLLSGNLLEACPYINIT